MAEHPGLKLLEVWSLGCRMEGVDPELVGRVVTSKEGTVRVPRSQKISIVPSSDTTTAIYCQDSNIEHDIDGNENSVKNPLVGDSDSEHHLCYFPPVLRGHMT